MLSGVACLVCARVWQAARLPRLVASCAGGRGRPVVHCAPALGLGRKAGACHHMLNSQGGAKKGSAPPKTAKGGTRVPEEALSRPQPLFCLAPRANFPVFRCAMAWVAHTLCYLASQHSCCGTDGRPLPVESKLSPSRRALFLC